MTTTTLPDVEAALLAFLATDADVTTARTVGGVKGGLGWNLGSSPAYPFLRVYRAGGPAEDNYLDRPLIQLEAIGAPNDATSATRQALSLLLRTAHGACIARLRWHTSSGVRFSGVQTVTQMQWAPDAETAQSRYFTRLTMAVHRAS